MNQLSMPDSEIVAAINRGNLVILEKVYQTYYSRLIQHLQSFRGLSNDDAHDIVHTVFLNIHKNHKTWYTTEVKPYLYASARNSATRLFKTRKREEKVSAYLESSPDYYISPQFADKETLTQEYITLFNRAVSQLEYRDREIYRLKIEESLTTSQIAECLNLSTNMVTRRLRRVKEHLESYLSHNGWLQAL